MLTKKAFLFITIALISIIITNAQERLPRCSEREFLTEFPRVDPLYWCIELPILADAPDDKTYTSIIFDADGILYATHPYRGEVVALTDTDGDSLPDREAVIAENLRYPNGITLYDDVLYVMGDGIVYTITGRTVETLVDDLPNGRGFIARGIVVYEDMLYVAIPSPCDFCEADDPSQGTVLRMQLDGTDREMIARGLRYPAGLEMYEGALWVTDIARDAYNIDTFYDEINRIDLSSDDIPHFGFPYCVGYDNMPDFESEFDCTSATAPVITLHTESSPIALTRYDSDTFPHLSKRLMVVLLGSNNNSFLEGHSIFSFERNDEGIYFEALAPVDNATANIRSAWQQANGRNTFLWHSEFVNNQAGGIFPHFAYDIAVSPEGWLYFSVNGKGIYVLRPQT